MRELEVESPWSMTAAEHVYLKVVKEEFFYTWDGRTEKHAPSKIYETDTFTLTQLEALCRTLRSK